MTHRVSQPLWLIVLLAGLLASVSLSWFGMGKVHYGFSYWYDFYGIEAHIDKYGPQNRYIRGLESVSPIEHIRLFNEISDAVHNHGEGLKSISFERWGHQTRLLRKPEVQHLQDVADLIDVLRIAAIISGLICVVGSAALLGLKTRPSWAIQGGLLLFLIAGITAAVLITGPLKVFYFLHEHIFPPDHAWFFYYQDSLMATLMKAPDLFGGIAAVIAIAGVVLFGGYLWLLLRAAAWRNRQV
ncbi:DUF1461 domain-containing protein [Oceanobacter mangrovi]|uniref:lipoprotein intramolecular transacylase Lit n=1 Tax=Oceanobacter mangrovi TaxID=2862510 RepID=UPI001C8DB8E6|nr:DUF1461 domain-containing protein [Oceanobacter mangrovi]